MIFLQVFFFHNTKLFSSQPFLNHVCLYCKILVKKALYISLFISGFGFSKTFCCCHRVPGVSTFILASWLSGYTLGFGFCMHMHGITSTFHSIHSHTIPPFTILAISPFPPLLPFSEYIFGFGFCIHMQAIPSSFHSISHHTIPPFSILAISLFPLLLPFSE